MGYYYDNAQLPAFAFYNSRAVQSRHVLARAWSWSLAACRGVRVLDLIGNVAAHLEPLLPTLANVQVVRVVSGSVDRLLELLPPSTRHLFYDFDGMANFREPRTSIPPIPPTIQHFTLNIAYWQWERPSLEEDIVIDGFEVPPSLKAITLLLDGVDAAGMFETEEPDDDTFSLPPFGFLANVIDSLVPHLQRIRLTVVNLHVFDAPGLGFASTRLLIPHDLDGFVPKPYSPLWDEGTRLLHDQFLAALKARIREHGADTGWSEDEVKVAVSNVQVMTRPEWEDELDDVVLTSWRPVSLRHWSAPMLPAARLCL